MRAFIASALVAAAALSGPHVTGAAQQSDVRAIESLFNRYVQLLNQDNADAIAAEIYAVPVLSVAADGTRSTISTSDELVRRWRALLDGFKRAGVQSRAIEKNSVCLVGADVAMAAVAYNLRRADGAVQRAGFLYLVQKTKGDWRIAMVSPWNLVTRLACSARPG